jgi:hypothetical protein
MGRRYNWPGIFLRRLNLLSRHGVLVRFSRMRHKDGRANYVPLFMGALCSMHRIVILATYLERMKTLLFLALTPPPRHGVLVRFSSMHHKEGEGQLCPPLHWYTSFYAPYYYLGSLPKTPDDQFIFRSGVVDTRCFCIISAFHLLPSSIGYAVYAVLPHGIG